MRFNFGDLRVNCMSLTAASFKSTSLDRVRKQSHEGCVSASLNKTSENKL